MQRQMFEEQRKVQMLLSIDVMSTLYNIMLLFSYTCIATPDVQRTKKGANVIEC